MGIACAYALGFTDHALPLRLSHGNPNRITANKPDTSHETHVMQIDAGHDAGHAPHTAFNSYLFITSQISQVECCARGVTRGRRAPRRSRRTVWRSLGRPPARAPPWRIESRRRARRRRPTPRLFSNATWRLHRHKTMPVRHHDLNSCHLWIVLRQRVLWRQQR